MAEQSQWEQAEDRFRRALSLRASPVIAYNLASALIERGKLVEATELLRKIEQDDSADAQMRHSAQTRRIGVEPRIGRITVIAHGKLEHDTVELDGNQLLNAQLEVEIPIDPGSHRVVLRRGGQPLDTRSVDIAPGASAQVALTQAGLAPTPRAVAAAAGSGSAAHHAPAGAVPEGSAGSPGPITTRWWFWTGVGGVAVAAVAVVAVLAAGSGGGSNSPAYSGDFKPGHLAVEVSP